MTHEQEGVSAPTQPAHEALTLEWPKRADVYEMQSSIPGRRILIHDIEGEIAQREQSSSSLQPLLQQQ
ncbi:MAG TPA: hypothetical protein VFQ63_02570 [Patescibacteria group bacterium]|nr:hypothetical protein [Patescibacteria group bacterium]